MTSDMLDLLRSLEWCAIAGPHGEDWNVCPECRSPEHDGKHIPTCRLAHAIRALTTPEPSPGEPTVGEMAREMGLDLDHGGFYGRMVNGEVVDAYAPKDIPPLYREHKAKRQPPPYAGIGPITQPTARQIAIAQAAKANSTGEVPPGYTDIILGSERPWPPTDPSALAEWLYARVVPGQTIVEYRWGDTMRRQAVVTEKGAAVDIDYVTIDILVGDGLFTIPGSPKVTRLLNPDGTVLWEQK